MKNDEPSDAYILQAIECLDSMPVPTEDGQLKGIIEEDIKQLTELCNELEL